MRLTEKLEPPYERVMGKDYVYTSDTRLTPSFASVEQKLGQLEDILEGHNIETVEELDGLLWYVKEIKKLEQELGIDLITLFKALKNGVYVKRYDYIDFCRLGIDENTQLRTFSFDQTNGIEFDYFLDFDDYGKVWALTKEELL